MQDALKEASDRLALGGDLFVRLEYQALDAGRPERFALVSPSTLDLFLDGRPVDRVRTYVRARLLYDVTVSGDEQGGLPNLFDPDDAANVLDVVNAGRSRTQVLLDQLWIKFDVGQRVFFTVGQQRVRWGTGRIWNPTDFLNAQRFDPLALFDPRLGVGLIKVHIPFEAAGANVYAIANVDGADRLDRLGAALRGEIAFGQMEVALSGSWRSAEPLRLGADLSTGFGPFELRGELAVLYDVAAPFFQGRWTSQSPLEFGDLSVAYRDREVIPQLVLGADITLDYGDGDELIVGAEYFYNDAGYDSADLYPVLLLAPTLAQAEGVGLISLGLREPPPALFQPLYLGRHYISAFALFPAPFGWQDHSFTLTGIANLSDGSAVGRLDHALRLFRFLSLRSYINVHWGARGEFRFGLDVGAIPGLLDEGVSFAPPLFELGVALNARF